MGTGVVTAVSVPRSVVKGVAVGVNVGKAMGGTAVGIGSSSRQAATINSKNTKIEISRFLRIACFFSSTLANF